MKKLLMGVIFALSLMFLTVPAQAQSGLALDVPISFTFKGDVDGKADRAGGYILSWSFPFNMGIGYEKVFADADDTTRLAFVSVEYTLTDIYMHLMAAGFNWQFGYGTGKLVGTSLDYGVGGKSEVDGKATTMFVTMGFPLGKDMSDFHFSYRKISTSDITEGGVPTTLSLDGEMMTIGFMVGI